MGKEEIDKLVKIWQDFAGLQTDDKFFLNPDMKRVEQLAKGVLDNEEIHGLKFCPCRITTGRFDDDIKIICPCNFRMQKTWQDKGECWCSLFVKKKS